MRNYAKLFVAAALCAIVGLSVISPFVSNVEADGDGLITTSVAQDDASGKFRVVVASNRTDYTVILKEQYNSKEEAQEAADEYEERIDGGGQNSGK